MSDYIPLDIIGKIFTKLSVDDVLRCTSVCKSWYSLIVSPSFASSYLNLSYSNQESRVLVRCNKDEHITSCYSLHFDSETFDEITEIDSPCSDEWLVIGCINGLFCLFSVFADAIMLWNPSLRKTFVLPKPARVLSRNESRFSHKRSVGFGFVGESNEYKIVSFSYDYGSDRAVQIYKLSTGSWRHLKLDEYFDVNVNIQQTHLNGILHWFSRNPDIANPSTFASFICSFDVKNEKFRALMVPSCLRYDDSYFVPSIYKDSLCLMCSSDRDKFCTIWIMKEYGVDDSWEKLFVIDKEQHSLTNFPYLRHNGELLFRKMSNETHMSKEELVSYDCNKNEIKNLGVLTNTSRIGPFLSIYTYVESVVLINGSNKAKIDEESTMIM